MNSACVIAASREKTLTKHVWCVWNEQSREKEHFLLWSQQKPMMIWSSDLKKASCLECWEPWFLIIKSENFTTLTSLENIYTIIAGTESCTFHCLKYVWWSFPSDFCQKIWNLDQRSTRPHIYDQQIDHQGTTLYKNYLVGRTTKNSKLSRQSNVGSSTRGNQIPST